MNLQRGIQGLLVGMALLLVTGCRHKQTVAPLPVPPPTQVPLAPAPEPTNAPQVSQVPVAPTPVPAKPVPKSKKPKKKPDPVVVATPPPTQVAVATPPPDVSVIGNLTAGGNAEAAVKQKAADVIADVEKRVSELPASTQSASRDGLAKVKDFLTKAKDALKTGDADGAATLATKAKLLLDDLLTQ